MNELLSLSPIDGRYLEKTKELTDSFSEYALIKYRVLVEIKWLLYLIDKKIINEKINKSRLAYAANVIVPFGYVFIFLWGVSFLILGAHNPFIYFNF